MARIVYGPLVTAVKGSIAGTTFQNNPSGAIIRARPRITRSSTIKQTVSHKKLDQLLFEWQNITQVQRDLWSAYASAHTKINKFGSVKKLTGQNWFTSVNWWRINLNESIFASPPPHNLPAGAPAFTVSINPSGIFILFPTPFVATNDSLIVWSSLPTKLNTLSINQIRKLVTRTETSPTSPWDITTAWSNATELDWLPSTLFPNSNIYVCLQTIRRDSSITSSFLCSKESTPPSGAVELIFYV